MFGSRDLTPYSSSLPTLAYIWPALAPDLGLYQDLERKVAGSCPPPPTLHPSGGVGGNLPAGPVAPALSWGRPPSRWPYLHVFILLLQAFISQKLVDGSGFPSCRKKRSGNGSTAQSWAHSGKAQPPGCVPGPVIMVRGEDWPISRDHTLRSSIFLLGTDQGLHQKVQAGLTATGHSVPSMRE